MHAVLVYCANDLAFGQCVHVAKHDRQHHGLTGVPQAIATEIKSATTSMTSVPKPLKFLRQHYSGLKATFEAMPAGTANKAALADVLSVLAMNSGAEGAREGLKFRLAGSSESVSTWGHEYVRYNSRAGCSGPH